MDNTTLTTPIHTTPYTVIVVPPNCHVMVPASFADILEQVRFAQITESGTKITPLPVASVQSITIPVEPAVLVDIDNASFKAASPK